MWRVVTVVSSSGSQNTFTKPELFGGWTDFRLVKRFVNFNFSIRRAMWGKFLLHVFRYEPLARKWWFHEIRGILKVMAPWTRNTVAESHQKRLGSAGDLFWAEDEISRSLDGPFWIFSGRKIIKKLKYLIHNMKFQQTSDFETVLCFCTQNTCFEQKEQTQTFPKHQRTLKSVHYYSF